MFFVSNPYSGPEIKEINKDEVVSDMPIQAIRLDQFLPAISPITSRIKIAGKSNKNL